MAHKAIPKRVAKIIGKINGDIGQLRDKHDTDVIHSFRVSYKQLRAMLRVAGMVKHNGNKKTFGAITSLYRAAGDLRDITIYNSSLNKYVVPNGIAMPTLEKQEEVKHLSARLTKAVNNFDSDSFVHLTKKSLDKGIGQSRIRKFIVGRQSSIESMLHGPMTDETLHEIRKYFKDVLYILPLLKKTDRNKSLRDSKKQIRVIADQLGEFLDTCTALRILKRDMAGILPEEIQAVLEKARIEWLLLKHRQKDKLLRKLLIK